MADLSRYKERQIGMRWRTEAEVVAGKGQFQCGAKRCDGAGGLQSFEARRPAARLPPSNHRACLGRPALGVGRWAARCPAESAGKGPGWNQGWNQGRNRGGTAH